MSAEEEKRDARDVNWERFIEDQPPLTTPRHEYDRAFDLGHAAATRWHSIEKEGDPKEVSDEAILNRVWSKLVARLDMAEGIMDDLAALLSNLKTPFGSKILGDYRDYRQRYTHPPTPDKETSE